ncbi:MAG TPA: T9SS type A sorting domain-containing protein, partial [Saprospiraceae bacterium]|nr:T9SS type A sorting domain-containing protein [Saprospiraceae bacterium]
LFTTTDFNTFNNSISPFYHDGKKMAYIGFEDGRLSLYEWEGDPLTGKWILLDANAGKVHRGNKLNTEIFDINSDGRMDLILGNFGGGVQFFSTPFQYQTSGIHQPHLAEIAVYPNPFTNVLTILTDDHSMSYTILDAAGRIIMTDRLLHPLTQINVADLPPGFYILQLTDFNGNLRYSKMMK